MNSPASSFLNVATDFATLSSIIDQSCGTAARAIEFKEIQKATKNFQWHLYLGQGDYGVLYKGWMQQNNSPPAKGLKRLFSRYGTSVAIKKLTLQSTLGFKALLALLKYQSQLDHPNVVKLVGYCCETNAMVLVYEFMSKGSLSNLLFSKQRRSFSWAKRIKVAVGAARGLAYLHGREMQVIHGNLNADNILLDGDINAKLSGFAFGENGHDSDTSVVSTRLDSRLDSKLRYVAPDLIATESDVFAFGVVLLELISGCRLGTNNLVGIEGYMNGETELRNIVDTKLEGQYCENGAHAILILAWQCLRSDPEQRPRMSDVLVALQRL